MIQSFLTPTAAASILLILAGCQSRPVADRNPVPARAFLGVLSGIEGGSFLGRVDESQTPANPFEGEQLIMHVREVSPDGARIALHVGEDHSRTWVLTRQGDGGLHLRHDHRYPDGTPHDLTDYGGYAAAESTATRFVFPADDLTAAMLPEAATNIWSMEITSHAFSYTLTRHGQPRFRAVFDLTDPR